MLGKLSEQVGPIPEGSGQCPKAMGSQRRDRESYWGQDQRPSPKSLPTGWASRSWGREALVDDGQRGKGRVGYELN